MADPKPMRTVPVDTLIRYLESTKEGGQTEIAHFEFHVRQYDDDKFRGDLSIWSHYQDKYGEVLAYIDSVISTQVEEDGRDLHERINKRRAEHEVWKEREATKRGHTLIPMSKSMARLGHNPKAPSTNFEAVR